MKIAYVSHRGRPCYEYEWFSRLDFSVIKFLDTDFSAYPDTHPENIEYCKVDFSENKFVNKLLHSTASVVYYSNFEKYLEDVDVVIVLEAFSSLSKQFAEYCKNNNKKIVVLVYELIARHPVYYLPTHVVNRIYTIKNADLFVCVSNKAKDHLLMLGADEAKIQVVYPGIDLSIFKPDSRDRNEAGIIFVGQLAKHKGIDIVLELYVKLHEIIPDLRLDIVGVGEYADKVKEFCLKYPNVTYHGRVPNNELPKLLNKNSIYILPARDTYKFGIKMGSEQFGFSLVEAMACGLVIVSTDCGAIPEIITVNNIVCKQNYYIEPLHQILALLKDLSSVHAIGKKNISIAQESYSIEHQAVTLTHFITKLISNDIR